MPTTSAELEELIDSTVNIPTIPTTLVEINRVVTSPDGSAKDAAEVIARDPAIAAKVLRLVNSSVYALRNPVSSIGLACSILGLKTIRNVVVQATVLQTFARLPEIQDFDTAGLWDHSFKAAAAARLLTTHTKAEVGLDKDEAYTSGLVHDVGKMILLQSQTQNFALALRTSRREGLPLAKAEAALFGFSHAHVAGLLARRWHLSAGLQAAVMYHHSPGAEAEEWVKGFLVHAANTLAHQAAARQASWIPDLASADSLAVLGIATATLDEIRTQVALVSVS